jgi:capsular exopolysaccharide synthesis family protein
MTEGEPAGEEGLPPALTEAASPWALLQALRRRWPQALLLGLSLAVLAGGLVWTLRPEKYTAYVLLRIAPAEPKILQDSTARVDLERISQYQKTQEALITSMPVLRAALKEEKIRQLPLLRGRSDPADWLEKELKAEIVEKTEVLKLSLSAREHPEDLAPIVNAVQEAYMDRIVTGEHENQLRLLSDMESIYGKSQEKLRAQREALRTLADSLKTGDSQILTIRQKNLLEEFASLKKELAGVQARLRDERVKLAAQQVKFKGGTAAEESMKAASTQALTVGDASVKALIDREVDLDPLIQKRLEDVYKIEDQIAQIDRTSANPNTPQRLDRQRQLDGARVVLEKARAERRAVVEARVRETLRAEGLLHTRETEEAIRTLEQQRQDLQAEVAKLGREVDRIGTNSIELELQRAEIDQADLVLKNLRTEKERLQVEMQSTAKRRVSVVAPAEEAAVLSKKAHVLETLAGAFGGLFLGLFGVSYREFQRRKIHTPTEVTRGLRMRVVGTVPAVPARLLDKAGEPHQASLEKWGQILAEAINAIRTMLLTGRGGEGNSLLMITSARSGEGKTTLASHLAISLARAGRRTLLVDCDLRNPSLHRHPQFAISRSPGVCELLARNANLEEVVSQTSIDGLFLLPAGQCSREAAAALARGALKAALQEIRGRFDFIIVDSSPVLVVADALMVARCADSVVFSVRPGTSQAPQVYAAYERLRDLNLPFVGTVVNGVSDKALYAEHYDYLVKAEG